MCGIFALFLCGVHVVLWWGLRCFPVTRVLYTAAYYILAAAAVLISTRANNVLWRAVPMLALCLVGAGAFVPILCMLARLTLLAASYVMICYAYILLCNCGATCPPAFDWCVVEAGH